MTSVARIEDLAPESSPRRTSDVRELAFKTTAARALIEALVANGVDTFFGIPGGPVSPVFDAVLGTPGTRLIESRHETSAAFGAAGYHRATGKVPAVIVTAGPGATNAVTGIASASHERVPMLLICGDVAWAAAGGRMAQDSGPEGIDVEHLFAKFVRAAVRVSQPRSAATQAMAALDAALDPLRPGPSLLVVPIQTGVAKTELPRIVRAGHDRVPTAPPAAVIEACELLTRAQRPLVVLGAGARPHAAKMRRLLDAFNIPFVTTPQAKGVVSELHPRSLRNGGIAASMWARAYTAGEGVDAAVVLGSDLDDSSVGPTPFIGPKGHLVHVDTDARVFNRNLPTSLSVLADVGSFADAMYEVVIERGLRNDRCAKFLREVKSQTAFDFAGYAEDDSPIITPARAVADLQKAAGADARFVTDIGEHMLFAMHYVTANGPSSFDIRLGLGSMGSGIAGAIGLALGNPKRRVVCICGDGGMQMVGAEAVVALQERLPIVYAVFNDARYNMVFHGYKQMFSCDAKWESPWIDFAGWANALGIPGARIHRPDEITPALLDRLQAVAGPVVLDIRIDRSKSLKGGGRVEKLLQMSAGPLEM